jgi:hypothetical protein
MIGGDGNDTFTVDHAGDVIIDSSGTDTVRTQFSSYTIAASIENVLLFGNVASTVTGNASNNTMTTSAYGGLATFYGGLGNDTYVISDTRGLTPRFDHQFIENPGEGTGDQVNINRTSNAAAFFTYTLPVNIENLSLFNTYLVNGVGSAVDNIMYGSNASNIGSGNPYSMTGGLGNDTYRVYTPLATVVEALGEGTDTIQMQVDFRLPANVENALVVDVGGVAANRVNAFGNELNKGTRKEGQGVKISQLVKLGQMKTVDRVAAAASGSPPARARSRSSRSAALLNRCIRVHAPLSTSAATMSHASSSSKSHVS